MLVHHQRSIIVTSTAVFVQYHYIACAVPRLIRAPNDRFGQTFWTTSVPDPAPLLGDPPIDFQNKFPELAPRRFPRGVHQRMRPRSPSLCGAASARSGHARTIASAPTIWRVTATRTCLHQCTALRSMQVSGTACARYPHQSGTAQCLRAAMVAFGGSCRTLAA